MKKLVYAILLAIGVGLLTAGYSLGTVKNNSAVPVQLKTVTQDAKLTLDPIWDTAAYDLNKPEKLPQRSLQELFGFYQASDGAFSKGAMAEMMERFNQDPNSFLSALAEAEQELQTLISDNLGVSIFFSRQPEYQDSLYDARNLGLNAQQSVLLEYIITAYESSASSSGT